MKNKKPKPSRRVKTLMEIAEWLAEKPNDADMRRWSRFLRREAKRDCFKDSKPSPADRFKDGYGSQSEFLASHPQCPWWMAHGVAARGKVKK